MKNSQFLLEVLRMEYAKRINEVLDESDAFDERGNLILAPDLKVRHKKSGYEYTIANVEGDEPGKIQIVLRDPEEPRFEPPPEGEEVLGGPEDTSSLNEQDIDPRIPQLLDPTAQDVDYSVNAIAALADDEPQDEVVFVIDQEEFEKEYEVD